MDIVLKLGFQPSHILEQPYSKHLIRISDKVSFQILAQQEDYLTSSDVENDLFFFFNTKGIHVGKPTYAPSSPKFWQLEAQNVQIMISGVLAICKQRGNVVIDKNSLETMLSNLQSAKLIDQSTKDGNETLLRPYFPDAKAMGKTA